MRELHVAAAQIRSEEPIDDTLYRIERQVHAAAVVGVDVILFSECVLQGYDYNLTPSILDELSVSTDGSACGRIMQMARRYDINVLVGLLERDAGDFYNSHLVAHRNGNRSVERKYQLTKAETSAGISAGPPLPRVFIFGGLRTSIIICEDQHITGLDDHLRQQKIDFQFRPSAAGGQISQMLHEEELHTPESQSAYERNRAEVFQSHAFLSQEECPHTGFASANALGPAGRNTCHQGHCLIVDNNRTVRAQIPGTNVLEHQQDRMIHAALRFPNDR